MVDPRLYGRHGTRTCYASGCRCARCTEAQRVGLGERKAQRYADRELTDGRLVATAAGLTHGNKSTYNNWGCRCRPCTEVNSARSAAYYRARRAAQ